MATKNPEGRGASHGASLQARLVQMRSCFPESERKLADLLVEFPGEIAAYSATELAQLAGTSKAAVTRFARRLGYSSFREAQISAREAGSWGSPVYLLQKGHLPEGHSARVARHIEQDNANIVRSFDGLDDVTSEQVVETLATAKRVWLLGFRHSYHLAGYARWQFMRVRTNVFLIPTGGDTLAEDLADLTPEDLFIAVGFRRRIPALERALDVVRGCGASILYMTDTMAPPCSAADWTIRCELRRSDPLDAHVAAMSVISFLSVALMDRMAATGRRRLTRIEELHDEMNEFAWKPKQ